MAAITLVPEGHRSTVCERRQRRQDMRELHLHVVVENRQLVRVDPCDVLIQCMHEDRERQVALELGCGPRQNQVPAQLGTSRKLVEEPGLADPRLTNQLDRSGLASAELVE